MYDYVIILTFDDNCETKIAYLKELVEKNGMTISKKLPPHITVDLYKDIDETTMLGLIEQFIKKIKSFPFIFIELDQFDNTVLFLQPTNLEQFEAIKDMFDLYLGQYKIKDNANKGIYHPHATLLTGDDVENEKKVLENEFVPFDATITDLCVYDKSKRLIRKYKLNNVD